MKKFATYVMVLLGLTSPLWAAETTPSASTKAIATKSTLKTEDSQQFDEIVVSATRTATEVDAAPAKAAVVKAADIAKRNVNSLDQSVKTLSGVYSKRTKGPLDTSASVTLHGIPDQKRTLILMDGVTMNTGYDGSAKLSYWDSGEIDRIEVVQGPASSLYGGNAMGGVLSVTTRMPDKLESSVRVVKGGAFKNGDSYDDYNGYYLSFGDKLFDKLSFYVGFNRCSQDGYPSDLATTDKAPLAGIKGFIPMSDKYGKATQYILGDKGINSGWEENYSARIQYDFTDTTRLKLGYSRIKNYYSYGAPNSYIKDANGNVIYTYAGVKEGIYKTTSDSTCGGLDNALYSLNFNTAINDISIKLNMGAMRQLHYWYLMPLSDNTTKISGGAGKYIDLPSDNYTTDLQASLPIGNRQILTFGSTYRFDKIDAKQWSATNYIDTDSRGDITNSWTAKDVVYGIFLQDEVAITDNLTAYIGARGDWWRAYDGEVMQVSPQTFASYKPRDDSAISPKIAFVYSPFARTTFKISAGKAFRAPSLSELYRDSYTTSSKTIGDPNLKPEIVKSWDISAKQGLWKGCTFELGYFENYLYDTISTLKISDSLSQRTNVGESRTKGFTLEVNQQISDWLKLYANTTRLVQNKITRNDPDPSVCGNKLNHPMRMVNVGAEAAYNNWIGSLSGRYISRRYSDLANEINGNSFGAYPDYVVADTKIGYTFKNKVTLSVSVDNVFNRNYYEYYKMPGRTWYVEMGFKL